MKQAYEIFQKMKSGTALSVFQYLRDEHRDVYKASISSLAANRKLRPVFIQKKPVSEQIDWLVKNAKLRGSGEIAMQVLQLWLLKGHQSLLIGFLDGLGIKHDGEGAADDLPDDLDAKKLKKTVSDLLKKHDPEIVTIYLHIFQLQRSEGWEEISKLIESTPELQFHDAEVAAPVSAPASAAVAEEETVEVAEDSEVSEKADEQK